MNTEENKTLEINGIKLEIRDRTKEIDTLLMQVKKAVYGLNGALRWENIPLKLKVETYDSEQDFKHLTNKDKSIIKEFPKTLEKQDLTNFKIWEQKTKVAQKYHPTY